MDTFDLKFDTQHYMLSNIQHRFYFGLRSQSVRILIRCSPAKYNLAFLVRNLSSGLHVCSNTPSSSRGSLWVSATQECGPVSQGLPHSGYGSDGLFIRLTLV